MATTVKTFDWSTDADSFTFTPASDATGTWANVAGNTVLRTQLSGRNKTDTGYWSRTLTFEAMDVPSGATVTGITSASIQSRVYAIGSMDSATIGNVTLDDGTTTVVLAASRTGPTGTAESSFTTQNGTDNTSLNWASNQSVTITLNHNLDAANNAGLNYDLFWDNLTFTITYAEDTDLDATTATATATTYDASINYNLSATTATASAATYQATVLLAEPVEIDATTATASAATYDASIDYNLQATTATATVVTCWGGESATSTALGAGTLGEGTLGKLTEGGGCVGATVTLEETSDTEVSATTGTASAATYDASVDYNLTTNTATATAATYTASIDFALATTTATASAATYDASVDYNLQATTGTATAATYTASIDFALATTTATATAATYQATLSEDTNIDATTGTADAATYDASVDYNLQATTGTAEAATYQATLSEDTNIDATTGTAQAATYQATLVYNVEVLATTATANAATYQATLVYNVEVLATTATANATAYAASLTADTNIDATTGTASAATYDASIDYNLQATTATASAATYAASLGADTSIDATTGTAQAATYDASIDYNLQATTATASITTYSAGLDGVLTYYMTPFTSDGVNGDVVNSDDTTTNLYSYCDDDADGLSSDYINNSPGVDGYWTTGATPSSVPANWQKMLYIDLVVDVQAVNFETASCSLTATLAGQQPPILQYLPLGYQNTEIADETDSTRTQRTIRLFDHSVHGEYYNFTWNGLRVEFVWDYSNAGSDPDGEVRLYGMELVATYEATAEFQVDASTATVEAATHTALISSSNTELFCAVAAASAASYTATLDVPSPLETWTGTVVSPDSNFLNVINSAGNTTNMYSYIDNAVDGSSADYVHNKNQQGGYAFFNITDITDTDFQNMAQGTLEFSVDVQSLNFETSTAYFTFQFFASDGVTAYTPETYLTTDNRYLTEADSTRTQRTIDFGFTAAGTSASRTDWNSALLKLTYSYNNISADNDGKLRTYGVQFQAQYTTSAITISCDAATANATTYAADVTLPVFVDATVAAATIATYQASLTANTAIDATTATANAATYQATLSENTAIDATTATANATAYAASLTEDTNIDATTGTAQATTHQASLTENIEVEATTGTATWTALAASVALAVGITATVGTWSATTHAADVTLPIIVNAAKAAAVATTLPAGLGGDVLVGASAATADYTGHAVTFTYDVNLPANYTAQAVGQTLKATVEYSSALTNFNIYPNGDIVDSGILNNNGNSTNLFSHVDNAADGSTADYIYNFRPFGPPYAYFNLTDLPTDFVAMESLSLATDSIAQLFSSSSCPVLMQVFASDGVTAYTDQLTGASHNDGIRLQRLQDFTLTAAGQSADLTAWNGARLHADWDYNVVFGDNDGEVIVYAIELQAVYQTGASDGFDILATRAVAEITTLPATFDYEIQTQLGTATAASHAATIGLTILANTATANATTHSATLDGSTLVDATTALSTATTHATTLTSNVNVPAQTGLWSATTYTAVVDTSSIINANVASATAQTLNATFAWNIGPDTATATATTHKAGVVASGLVNALTATAEAQSHTAVIERTVLANTATATATTYTVSFFPEFIIEAETATATASGLTGYAVLVTFDTFEEFPIDGTATVRVAPDTGVVRTEPDTGVGSIATDVAQAAPPIDEAEI